MNKYLSAYMIREELDPNEYAYVISSGCYIIDKTEFATERPSGRSDYQLIYIRKGVLRMEGEPPFGAGEVILYRPYTPQHYVYTPYPQSEYYWIHFNGTGMEQILQSLGFCRNFFNVGNSAEIAASFNAIVAEIKQRNFGFNAFCSAELVRLLALIGRARNKTEFPDRDGNKEKFKNVVDSMHSSGIHTSIEEYAQMCFMSKYRFIHAFKNIMGMPPHAYQQRIVLIKAQDLLLNSSLSITEISEELGFSDIYYFSKFFKNQTGVPPATYRKNNR